MECLVCKRQMEEYEITPGLKVDKCCECGGIWLRFDRYMDWYHQNTIQAEESNTEKNYKEINDSTNPKLCPDCGRLLTVYRVANNLNFRLEHCFSCNGIWFDKNEWETLRENSMHNQIHKFFTDSWQKKLKDEERREYFEKFYIRKFGESDYKKIKEIKAWLDNNENKSMLIAFIMNNDPYKL